MSLANLHRQPGLDYLRLLAIVLVTVQHGMSVLGLYGQTDIRGISYGQLGVAIFCAISGFLAFGRPGDSVGAWLFARLKGIFPAYWVAMLFSFLVTWIFHAKDFSTWQFVSQMLGMGYFTHGWNLVNVVSWFISLILLCYLIAAVARMSGRPLVVLGTAALAAMALLVSHVEVDLSRHVLAFVLGGCLYLLPVTFRKSAILLLAIFLLAMWFYFSTQFLYAALAVPSLYISVSLPISSSLMVAHLSRYIYEYFLIHGIFLVGMVRFMPSQPFVGVIIAILMSMASAYILRRALSRII